MNRSKFTILALVLLIMFSIVFVPGCIPEVPDIDAPLIQILYPSGGSVVNGTIPVVVAASDDDEVKEIRIYIDGVPVFTTGSNFATYNWDTSPMADNLIHYISAAAIDESDNVGYTPVTPVTVVRGQSPDITPPVVAIIYPVNGQVLSGTVNVIVEARDDSEVDRVEFYIDGSVHATISDPPFDYVWNTTSVDSGSHVLFMRAYDTNNNSSASNTITVTVIPDTPGDNMPPVVRIVSPNRNHSLFSKSDFSTVPIEIETYDDADIEKIELYIDGEFIEVLENDSGEDRGVIRYDWALDGYGDGLHHSIFVKAFDRASNVATDMILVRINP